MTDPETNLHDLHRLYCTLTGRNLTYQFYVREWANFAKVFNADDLRAVLAWVDRVNKKREWQYRIRTDLLKLIGDLAVFDSLKAEAELDAKARAAKARAWQPTAGQVALAEMRHEEVKPPETEPRMAKELIINSLDRLKSDLEKQ